MNGWCTTVSIMPSDYDSYIILHPELGQISRGSDFAEVFPVLQKYNISPNATRSYRKLILGIDQLYYNILHRTEPI